jgi:hypothetical protein
MEKVIELVQRFGFKPDGETRTETVRIPTTRVPLTCGGKGGGEIRTFGGRQRFRRADGRKVTVGRRSVYFYDAVETPAHFKTKEFDEIQKYLEGY